MKRVVLWVCPTEGCPNYYASSSQEHLDLTKEEKLQADTARQLMVGRAPVTGHRSDCPDCRRSGRGVVTRVRIATLVDTDLPGSAAA